MSLCERVPDDPIVGKVYFGDVVFHIQNTLEYMQRYEK